MQVVSVDMEETTVSQSLAGRRGARPWGEFDGDPMKTLAALLTDMGLAAARIGIEMEYLPAGDFTTLWQALPKGEFQQSRSLLCALAPAQDAGRDRTAAQALALADSSITDAFASVGVGAANSTSRPR